jgi:enoyl-CoA hydratase/carnithine racemase
MPTPELHIDRSIARITLRRPEQANRLEPDDLAVIEAHLTEVNARPEVLVLQLRAEGRTFCSGYDIGQLGASRAVSFDRVADALEAARPITLAVMQGGVHGGATDLALACDFRLGVVGMEMVMPAARLGLHLYRQALERYVSRLGLDQAKRLILGAEKIGAEDMKAIGFLTHLVTAERLDEAARGLSQTLSAMAPLALLPMKQHLNHIARGMLDPEALKADAKRAATSADLREGISAWRERRPPRFNGC